MKKPNLDHAEVIKRISLSGLPKSVLKYMSPEAIAHIEKFGVKEIGTNNLAVGEWFIIEKYLPGDYHKFATGGLRSELSVFRMAFFSFVTYIGNKYPKAYHKIPNHNCWHSQAISLSVHNKWLTNHV